MYLSLLELINRAAERPLFIVEQIFVPGWVVMSVKGYPNAVGLKGLEWVMNLEQVGTGKAEHPAGIPMSGQHSHAAVTVALLLTASRLRGCECRLCGFPSPEADDIQQSSGKAEQDQAQELRFHRTSD